MYFHNKPIREGMKREYYPKGFETYLIKIVKDVSATLPFVDEVRYKDNSTNKNNSSFYIRLKCSGLKEVITLSFRTHPAKITNKSLILFRLDKIKNVNELKALVRESIVTYYYLLKKENNDE